MTPSKTPIPTGLIIDSQIPLNNKEYFIDEATLINLGTDDELAFTYYKGMPAYCALENTNYRWKEIEVGDVGKIPINFTYPNGWVQEGIDYSNKIYNFVLTESSDIPQDLQSVLDTGNIATQGTTGSYQMTDQYFKAEIAINPGPNMESGAFDIGGNVVQMGGSYGHDGIVDIGGISITGGLIELRQQIDFANNKKIRVRFQEPLYNDVNLLFPTKETDGTYILATLDNIPNVDGSETKLISSITTDITGTGTASNQYKVEVKKLQKVLDISDFTLSNYTLTNSDDEYLIFVNNGATNVTITVPTGLKNAFFVAVLQMGTGTVSFIASSTTINPSIGLKIKGQNNVVALDKLNTTEIFYLTGENIV